jgi:hypothetical protein
MDSSAMIHIPGFINTSSAIRFLIGKDNRQTDTHTESMVIS